MINFLDARQILQLSDPTEDSARCLQDIEQQFYIDNSVIAQPPLTPFNIWNSRNNLKDDHEAKVMQANVSVYYESIIPDILSRVFEHQLKLI